MARISALTRSLSNTIPLARSVADRAVVTARPIVFGVVGRVAAHLPGRSRGTARSTSEPETFTPSKPAEVHHETHVQTDVETSTGPSPASIARNVAAPRPSAKQPTERKPRAVPGAKLPVSRPSPST